MRTIDGNHFPRGGRGGFGGRGRRGPLGPFGPLGLLSICDYLPCFVCINLILVPDCKLNPIEV